MDESSVRSEATTETSPGMIRSSGRQQTPQEELYKSLPTAGSFGVSGIRSHVGNEAQDGSRLIRVIDLEPSHHLDPDAAISEALVGHLCIVDLASSPQFTALSYVWGTFSPSNADSILLQPFDRHSHHNAGEVGQGFPLTITKNCGDALRAVRRTATAPVSIWVDAICINQADEAEKSAQIPLMAEIYTWAAMVYIWIGEGSDEIDSAFRKISRFATWLDTAGVTAQLGHFAEASIEDRSQNRMKLVMHLWMTLLKMPLIELYRFLVTVVSTITCFLFEICSTSSDNRWVEWFGSLEEGFGGLGSLTLSSIVTRPWFHRGWTYQELILASDMTILCGRNVLSWEQLIRGLNHGQAARIRSPNYREPTAAMANVRQLVTVWASIKRPRNWNDRLIPVDDASRSPIMWLWRHPQCIDNISNNKGLLASIPVFLAFLALTQDIRNGYLDDLVDRIFPPKVLLAVVPCLAMAIVLDQYGDGYTRKKIWGREVKLPRFSTLPESLNYYSNSTVNGIGSTMHREEQRSTSDFPLGIVQAIRERRTTNPKDRFYAFHGILTRFGVNLPPPDYTHPISQIYSDLFKSLLDWNPRLINLMIDAGPPRLQNAPSWVPNWTILDTESRTPFAEQVIGKNIYNLASHEPTFEVMGHILQVRGRWVGSITSTFQPRHEGYSRSISAYSSYTIEHFTKDTLKFAMFQNLLKQCDKPGRMQLDLPNIIAEVLPDRFPGIEADDRMNFAIEALCEALTHLSPSILQLRGFNDSDFRNFLEDHPRAGLLRDTMEYISHQLNWSQKCLFLTNDGSVGYGIPSIREHDKVALIDGVCIPMIVREAVDHLEVVSEETRELVQVDTTRYVVVGPAYIMGLVEAVHFEFTPDELLSINLV